MTAIVSVDTLLTRMGQRDIPDITDLLTVAVNAATLQIQSMLDAQLDYATVTERWYIPPDALPRRGVPLKLRLNNGFVDSTAAISITVADKLIDLGTANAQALDSTMDFVVDYPKGLVYIEQRDEVIAYNMWAHLDPTLRGAHLSVQYSYGFKTQNDAYGKIYTNTPNWLVEAAALVATELFKDTMDVDKKRSTNLMGTAASFLDQYRRYFPTGLRPVL